MYTWYLLGAILWVIFAFWPAIIAKRKGYSFILFFLLSIFLFVISLIVAYSMKDKTKTARDIADEKAVNKVIEREEHKA